MNGLPAVAVAWLSYKCHPTYFVSSDGSLSLREGWRRGRDSNPRIDCSINTLAVCPIRPLWHLSLRLSIFDFYFITNNSVPIPYLVTTSKSPSLTSKVFSMISIIGFLTTMHPIEPYLPGLWKILSSYLYS